MAIHPKYAVVTESKPRRVELGLVLVHHFKFW